NASGRLLFSGALQGSGVSTVAPTNNQALMSTRNGFKEIIGRRGDAFPDATGTLVSGVPATDAAQYNTVGNSATADMNNAGRVVYPATLRTAAAGTPTTN